MTRPATSEPAFVLEEDHLPSAGDDVTLFHEHFILLHCRFFALLCTAAAPFFQSCRIEERAEKYLPSSARGFLSSAAVWPLKGQIDRQAVEKRSNEEWCGKHSKTACVCQKFVNGEGPLESRKGKRTRNFSLSLTFCERQTDRQTDEQIRSFTF